MNYHFPNFVLVIKTFLQACNTSFTAAHLTCQLFKLTAGSSSIDESQKMDRPSISVMSPTSPGMLRDLPLVLPGQLSVSVKPLCRENI